MAHPSPDSILVRPTFRCASTGELPSFDDFHQLILLMYTHSHVYIHISFYIYICIYIWISVCIVIFSLFTLLCEALCFCRAAQRWHDR